MIRGVQVGLLFFDLPRMESIENISTFWIPLIEKNSELDFASGDGNRFILIGNKLDLISNSIEYIETEMDNLAELYDFQTQLISTKTGIGMEQFEYKFLELIDKVM